MGFIFTMHLAIYHYHCTEICLHVIFPSQLIDARPVLKGLLLLVCGAWGMSCIYAAFCL
jgi:hypothetical protein